MERCALHQYSFKNSACCEVWEPCWEWQMLAGYALRQAKSERGYIQVQLWNENNVIKGSGKLLESTVYFLKESSQHLWSIWHSLSLFKPPWENIEVFQKPEQGWTWEKMEGIGMGKATWGSLWSWGDSVYFQVVVTKMYSL